MINRILTYTGNIPVNQPLPRNKNKLELISIKSAKLSQSDSLKKSLHKLYRSRIYGFEINQETINNDLIKIIIRFETSFHAYDPEFHKIEKLLKRELKAFLELRSTQVERPEGYNKPEVIHPGEEIKILYEDGVMYDEKGFDKAINLLTKSNKINTRPPKAVSSWEILVKNFEWQKPELN